MGERYFTSEQPEGPDLEAAHIEYITGDANVRAAHDKPDAKTATPPWEIHDCECLDRFKSAPEGCEVCDGHGWHFWNVDDGEVLSPPMMSDKGGRVDG
jgi:hypothetical protein